MWHEDHTLVDAISDTFSDASFREALWIDGESYSYAELRKTVAGIQALIQNQRVGNNLCVGVVAGDDFLTYASLLAIWASGNAYVPLNRHNPAERNARILQEAAVSVVLSSRGADDLNTCLSDVAGTITLVDTRDAIPADREIDFSAISPDSLAYIFFTSGSTGTPKGVPIRHKNLNAFMSSVMTSMDFEFSADDRFLQMFELTFDLSVMTIFAPWCCGASCYVVPDRGISYMNIADILTRREISVALLVPSVLSYLQRFFEEISLPSLRLSLFCGESLAHEMVRQWSSCVPNARIENLYGPTEATIFCTSYTWTEDKSEQESVNGVVPIGLPMRTCSVWVLDEGNQPCDIGQRGELALGGPQVMERYWNNTGKTAQVFVDVDAGAKTAYRTGDIALVNQNGNLIHCGRLDAQVKIDGHRVELGEIEHFARTFVDSANAAVVLVADGQGHSELHLFVAADNVDVEDLSMFLKRNLPDYMIPRHIHKLQDMPLNLNGKIDRNALVAITER